LNADIAALGLDAGSTTTKIVGVTATGALVWHHLEPTEPRLEEQVESFLSIAHGRAGRDDLPLVGTGYGRNLVQLARRKVTEITCHARGVFKETTHGGTLIDIGGQDTKVIVIGKSGNVENFAMNDKCAAGTGRYLEVTAKRLRVHLEDLGNVALSSPEEVSISSTCTVFAESEIVSLIARGNPTEHIVRGLHRSLIRRISARARSAGLTPPVMLSGGVALNKAVREILSEELDQPVLLPHHPQLMGAYGAALIALEQQPAP
jgi:predicted CoA-substrate-specific enzyme activase